MSIVSTRKSLQVTNASVDAKVPTITKLWNLMPTKNWGQDNKAGQRFADSLLRDMQKSGEVTKLEAVLKEIITDGQIDGTHVGFLHRVATMARNGYLALFALAFIPIAQFGDSFPLIC